jgi:hypothetical protein
MLRSRVFLAALTFLSGVGLGGYLFSDSKPRSFLAVIQLRLVLSAKRPRGTLMVAALSATVGLVLFLIWALNQPFAGLIRVEPVAFHQVWSIIG